MRRRSLFVCGLLLLCCMTACDNKDGISGSSEGEGQTAMASTKQPKITTEEGKLSTKATLSGEASGILSGDFVSGTMDDADPQPDNANAFSSGSSASSLGVMDRQEEDAGEQAAEPEPGKQGMVEEDKILEDSIVTIDDLEAYANREELKAAMNTYPSGTKVVLGRKGDAMGIKGDTMGIKGDTMGIKDDTLGTKGDTLGRKDPLLEELFYSEELSEEIKNRINGKSYGEDCDIPYEELRYIRVLYRGFDDGTYIGELIVNKAIAEDILDIFRELYAIDYPIERMVLVDDYDAEDELSMAADNTSAFNFRFIAGTTRLSKHSLGCAIDINPLYNPYITKLEGKTAILPKLGEEYADRTKDCPYYICKDDPCYQAFISRGFTWGGEWENSKDYQHFQKVIE